MKRLIPTHLFKKPRLAAALLAVAGALALPGGAQAGTVWSEHGPGGAGDLLSTAQVTYDSAFNALDAITGSLSSSLGIGGNPVYQVDLYKIRLTAATFSARTLDADFDTALYLFDAAGHGVYANDDDGASLLSALPAGDAAGPLSDGVYYLAVAVGGFIAHDASNLSNFLASLSSTDVVAGDANAGPLAGWTPGFDNFEEAARSYRIALTGATNGELPEPASLGLALAAGLGALAARRQRKAA
jgi:hypothetical protein